MKRTLIISALLAFLMLLPTAAMGYDFMVDGIYYNVYNSQAQVTNDGQSNCYSGDVVIPETATNEGTTYPVVGISDYAFHNCPNLNSVTIPNSVTTINYAAFYGCKGLTEITLPDALTSIGHHAFKNCTGITRIIIPDAVRIIGPEAFSGCTGLVSVTLGDGVYAIAERAFKGCTGLTNIVIPCSNTIGDYLFEQCSQLDSVTFGSEVATIGNTIFHGCQQLKNVTCLAIRPPALCYGGLLDGVDDYARVSLHVLPESVDAYQSALYWKDFLQVMGDATIDISEVTDGFGYDFKVDGIYYKVENGQAIVTYNGRPNSYIGDVAIPAEVTYEGMTYPVVAIGEKAFNSCINMTSVTIPNSVTVISDLAFYDCRALTEITLPDALTSIGSDAFSFCSGLTHITLPDALITIGDFAFYACSGLTSMTIPESVTEIGGDAFDGCTQIKSVVFNAVDCTHTGNYSMFFDCPLESIVFGDAVRCIPSLIAKDKTLLTSVTIPNSVTSIRWEAFAGCEGITDLVIGNSVNAIGPEAFKGCKGLTDVALPNSLTTLDSYSFSNCTGLTAIIIPDAVTIIGEGVFQGCSQLDNVKIGSGVTYIGYIIFYNCSQLNNVICTAVIPPDVNSGFFNNTSYYDQATLHVQPESIEAYMSATYWQNFGSILGDVVLDNPWDVNNDGEVTVADANSVVVVIVNGGGSSSGHSRVPADVNGDGEVGIADFNAIIDFILNNH